MTRLRRTGRGLILLMLALLGLMPWLRSPIPPPSRHAVINLAPLPLEPGCCTAGPLRLLEAWQMTSQHELFGGYSALLQPRPGRLLALSDRGYFLEFSEPGARPEPVRFGTIVAEGRLKDFRDVEAATWDPAGAHLWVAMEGRNAISRHRLDMAREAFREVPEMRDWPLNQGPEAMLRLADGRFVVLCECNPGWFQGGRHPGLLFAGDPDLGGKPLAFTFAGVDGYRPTDLAQLPDGRVLILARRLTWPVPARFAIKLLLADPAEIAADGTWQGREVADLGAPWPVDNYEGLAIERQADGKLIAWLISDENSAATQRVLLLKVEIDESKLAKTQRAPGSPDAP